MLLWRRNGALALNQRDDFRVSFELLSGFMVLHRISLDTVGVTKRYNVRGRRGWSVM